MYFVAFKPTMSVQIVKKQNQAPGAFDFGRILENKPVGFPHESGELRSMSNLFYWAHAWSDTGGLIDTHPHQGFEIMSYVVEGAISHHDSKNQEWLSLSKGDAQLIQAGKGISHAEKFLPGGKIFQIWFDPDLRKTMQKEAVYSDIKAADFPFIKKIDWSEKIIIGPGSPLDLDTEGIAIVDYEINPGIFTIPLDQGAIYAAYLISGQGKVELGSIEKDDLLKVEGETQLSIEFSASARLFIIKMPIEVSYPTYAKLQGA